MPLRSMAEVGGVVAAGREGSSAVEEAEAVDGRASGTLIAKG